MTEGLSIRPAEKDDISGIGKLLLQVHDVHAQGRPDLFQRGARKYSDEQLYNLLADETCHIFVAVDKDGTVIGHAFCVLEPHGSDHGWNELLTLYVDDICVDKNARSKGVARALWDYVVAFAREKNCYDITLNVWECNPSARAFYEAMGLVAYKTGMEFVL